MTKETARAWLTEKVHTRMQELYLMALAIVLGFLLAKSI